jgi:hypothetical protein
MSKNRAAIFSTTIQYGFGIPIQSNKTTTRNKRLQIVKEEVKQSLFADDMILYLRVQKTISLKNINAKILSKIMAN